MKTYIRIFGRPMGVEPKLFSSIEEATIVCQCEDECNPWCQPHIEEFNSVKEARRWIEENYPMSYEELVAESLTNIIKGEAK